MKNIKDLTRSDFEQLDLAIKMTISQWATSKNVFIERSFFEAYEQLLETIEENETA